MRAAVGTADASRRGDACAGRRPGARARRHGDLSTGWRARGSGTPAPSPTRCWRWRSCGSRRLRDRRGALARGRARAGGRARAARAAGRGRPGGAAGLGAAAPAALAPALSDLPVLPDGAWPADRPDPRRARARRVGGQLGIALDLEVALDAERRGAAGDGAVAVRRRHRRGPGTDGGVDGHQAGGARRGRRRGRGAGAGAPGGRRPRSGEAASLLAEAAAAYERAGRVDDAITALAKCIELRPDDSTAYLRALPLLRTDLDVPGRAELFDALLSHRLAAAPLTPAARVALLFERGPAPAAAAWRIATAAFADFKEILKIQPEHREALHQLARGASEDRDAESAAHWLVQFLAAAADDARAPEARLDLAACVRGAEGAGARGRHLAARGGLPARRPEAAAAPVGPAAAPGRVAQRHRDVAGVGGAPARHAGRAALHLRIGSILRDLGRDAPDAAQRSGAPPSWIR